MKLERWSVHGAFSFIVSTLHEVIVSQVLGHSFVKFIVFISASICGIFAQRLMSMNEKSQATPERCRVGWKSNAQRLSYIDAPSEFSPGRVQNLMRKCKEKPLPIFVCANAVCTIFPPGSCASLHAISLSTPVTQ